jgi:hypothetical protein
MVETLKRSENSEIMIKFTDPDGFQVRFERISFRPNAQPNLAFRFRYLLNLNPNAASGSSSVQVRTDFRTEPCHHYEVGMICDEVVGCVKSGK